MARYLLFILAFLPVVVHGAPRFNAFAVADRSAAMLLVAALFYFGYKWRNR